MSPLWIPVLPLLAVQALATRRRAQRLPEAAGPREGREGHGAPLRLLVLGDSAAAGVGVAHQRFALAGQLAARLAEHNDLRWRLLATSGATTRETLRALEADRDAATDIVVTSLGVNDVTSGSRISGFVEAQSALIEHLRTRLGARLVIASGLPPVHRFPAIPQPLRRFLGDRAERFDAALAGLAVRRGDFVHLPLNFTGELDESAMAEDGFHPGMPIYREWAAQIALRILNAPELAAAPQARRA